MSFTDYLIVALLFGVPIFCCGYQFRKDLVRWKRAKQQREIGEVLLNRRTR